MTPATRPLFLATMIVAVCFWHNGNLAAGQTSTPTSPAPAATGTPSDKPHGLMPAELTKSLDSKKLKQGDLVVAKITAELHTKTGGTIPRGSTLTGQVTESKARSKGDAQSALGIRFDKLTTPDGKEMAIKAELQAVGPSLHTNEAASTSPGPGMMAGRDQGMSPGTTPPPMPSMDQKPPSSAPVLNGQSKGVVGIRNVELGENSVLFSSGKEVKLDSGTQMIVQVEIE